MPKAFDFSAAPFDRLRPGEAERLRSAIDIAFFGEGETILEAGAVPDNLVIIMKGLVEALDGERPVDRFGPGECFDSGILVHQRCRFAFRAVEETLAYLLPIDLFIEFTANNQPFAAYFLGDISHRLSQLETRLQTAGDGAPPPLAMMRVSQLPLHPPAFVDGAADLHAAAAALEA